MRKATALFYIPALYLRKEKSNSSLKIMFRESEKLAPLSSLKGVPAFPRTYTESQCRMKCHDRVDGISMDLARCRSTSGVIKSLFLLSQKAGWRARTATVRVVFVLIILQRGPGWAALGSKRLLEQLNCCQEHQQEPRNWVEGKLQWNLQSVGSRSASSTANISINMLLLWKIQEARALPTLSGLTEWHCKP